MTNNNTPTNAKPFRFAFTVFVLLVVALCTMGAFDLPWWAYTCVGGAILVFAIVYLLVSPKRDE